MRALGASRTSVATGGILGANWARDPLWKNARAVPSLDLRFAENKSLTDATTGASLVTFTRASTGTFVGSDGLLRSATTDEARFDHNPTTGESLGLLVEEARTNLSLYSEDFSNAYWTKTDCTITANESTAPDGTTTADLWTNTASPGTINNSITKDATIRTYTSSVWVKGTMAQFTITVDSGSTANRGRIQYNLTANTVSSVFNEGTFTGTSGTLTPYPNGWVRLTLTTTTSTGTTIRFRPFFSGTGSTVRIWGAEVEEGAFPTSYIPTTTATVTRAADVASITGANFSSWYRQDEGTVFVEGGPTNPTLNKTQLLLSINDGSANNRMYLGKKFDSTTAAEFGVTSGGVGQAFILTTPSSISNARFAAGYKVNDFAVASSGGALATDTSGSVPVSSTQLLIGTLDTVSNNINGTIKRLTYWPVRLANTTLQAITQP